MLAAVVSYLGGKLRDYRGHYGASLDEMELAVAVWSQCIVALQPAERVTSDVQVIHGRRTVTQRGA